MEDIQNQMWAHGFIPRVNGRSRPGIMQALGPRDLFTKSELSLPYMIVDAHLTLEDSDLQVSFRDRDVSMIVDTQAWRYSDSRTWNSKWGNVPYAPQSPFNRRRTWVHDYTISDLSAQITMGSSYLMLPGWFTSLESVELARDVATWTLEAFGEFRRKGVLVPAIAWLPARIGAAEASLAAAEAYVESGAVRGIYVQWARANGLHDPVDRLKRSAKLLLEIQNLGLPVIAGHFGSIGLVMRAVGIAAADCGPCEGQSFDFSDSIRAALPQTQQVSSSTRKALPVRMWVRELGQTVTARQMAAIRESRTAFAEVYCRRACHRFRLGRDTLAVAVHHSTLSLCEEARQQSTLPISMLVDAAARSLREIKTRIELINPALTDEKQALRQDHLDVQLALLAEASTLHGVA
jgi:hypothetical protein